MAKAVEPGTRGAADTVVETKTSVIYTGRADVRVIRANDVEGLEKDLVWNAANDFSVPTEGMADDVVEFLRSLPDVKVK